jgi:hypothetical protein
MTNDEIFALYRTFTGDPKIIALSFALGTLHPALPSQSQVDAVLAFAAVPSNELSEPTNRAALAALVGGE